MVRKTQYRYRLCHKESNLKEFVRNGRYFERDFNPSRSRVYYWTEADRKSYELICKDLSIGADSKTINSIMPDLIPTFNVQLANKYFDKPDYVEGKEFAITTKIDGGRIIAIKENGQVSFFTRAGQKYEGLVDLEDEMYRLMPDNCCLDGEITLLARGNLSSKEAYKETMKIVRTKDKEKHGIKMQVFDWMPAEDFKKQKCDMPYKYRRIVVNNLFDELTFRYFELLPLLYVGEDTSKIPEILEEEMANGEEGIMINVYDAPYEFKRTNSLLKVNAGLILYVMLCIQVKMVQLVSCLQIRRCWIISIHQIKNSKTLANVSVKRINNNTVTFKVSDC